MNLGIIRLDFCSRASRRVPDKWRAGLGNAAMQTYFKKGTLLAALIVGGVLVLGALNLRDRLNAALAPTDGIEWRESEGGLQAISVRAYSPLASQINEGDFVLYLSYRGEYKAVETLPALRFYLDEVGTGNKARYLVERPGASNAIREVEFELMASPRRAGSSLWLALIGLIYMAVGLLLVLTQRRSATGYNFFAWFAACFILCFYATERQAEGLGNLADFIYRAALALTAPLFLHFCARFPLDQWRAARSRRVAVVALYLPAAEIIALEAAAHFAGGLFAPATLLKLEQWLDAVELLQCALFSVIGLLFLARSFAQSRASILRQQLRWFIAATLLLMLAVAALYFWQANAAMTAASYAMLALAPLMLGYATLRYRLADVDLSARYGFIHILAALAIGAVYALTLWAFGDVAFGAGAMSGANRSGVWAITIAGMLLMALLLAPVREKIKLWADRRYFGNRYALRRDVHGFGQMLTQAKAMEPLLELVARRVSDTVAVDSVAIFVADSRSQSGFRLAMAWKIFESIILPDDLSDKMKACLKGKGFVSARELNVEEADRVKAGAKSISRQAEASSKQQAKPVKASKRRSGAESETARDVIGLISDGQAELYYYIPCVAGERITTILAVGRGRSGALLAGEDIDLLKELSGFIAVAINNSVAYQTEANKAREMARESESLKRRSEELTKRAEETARLKEFSDSIIESAAVGIMIIDGNGRIASWNKGMEEMLAINRSQAIGRDVRQTLDGELIEAIQRATGESLWKPGNARYIYKQSVRANRERALTVNISIAPFNRAGGSIIVFEDVSDLVTVERQLQQKDRLSIIGLIAAVVGDEISAPLVAMSPIVQALLREIPVNDPKRRWIEEIHAQMMQASEVIGGMMSASGYRQSRKMSVNDLIDESLEMIASLLRDSRIVVARNYSQDVPPMRVKPLKLRQVFLNLILSARDRMAEGGRIIIQTRLVDNSVVINLRDTGAGVALEEVARIHDPSLSAVEAGTGADVGLILCYSIIQEHGGRMFAQSRPGEGTHFSIKLPVSFAGEIRPAAPSERDQNATFFRKYSPRNSNLKRIG